MKKVTLAAFLLVGTSAAMAAGKPATMPTQASNSATRAISAETTHTRATPAMPRNATAAARVAEHRHIRK